MPKFYKAALISPDGNYHVGVHALNLDLIQAIRPMVQSKYLYAIFADRPSPQGGWRGTFLDPNESDPELFTAGDMVPVGICGDDGLPMLGKAAVNTKFFTHFETAPHAGRSVWMLFGVFPGMKLALDPERSQALLSSQEKIPKLQL